MSHYLYQKQVKEYRTKENHPWRGVIFNGWAPGTYQIDGKPYCPDAWILTHPTERSIFAVQNSKADCSKLIRKWGAKVNWNPVDAAPAPATAAECAAEGCPVSLEDLKDQRLAELQKDLNRAHEALDERDFLRDELSRLRAELESWNSLMLHLMGLPAFHNSPRKGDNANRVRLFIDSLRAELESKRQSYAVLEQCTGEEIIELKAQLAEARDKAITAFIDSPEVFAKDCAYCNALAANQEAQEAQFDALKKP